MREIIAVLLAVSMLLLCSGCSITGAESSVPVLQITEESAFEEHEYSTALQGFIAEIRKGNYLNAVEEYNDNIHGNSVLENEASLYLQDLLYNTLEAYNQGTASETEFNNVSTTVEKVDDSLHIITFALTDAQEIFAVLVSSKANYQSGSEYMENGDYLAAADCFSQVASSDTNYEDAQSCYETAMDSYARQVIQAAEEKIACGEYETALGIVDEGEIYTGVLDAYESLRAKAHTMAAEARVNNALDDGDYPAARAAYESNIGNSYVTFSVETITRLETAETDYRNSIKDSARQAADRNDYVSALSVVEDGLAVLENDPELLALQEELQTEYDDYLLRTTPVSLTELAPYKEEGKATVVSGDACEDAFGNTYAAHLEVNSIYFSPEVGSATYRIDGIYATLTGTLFVKSTFNTSPDNPVTIYGDGKKLFERFISAGDDPFSISIDISGVKDLKISIPVDAMLGTVYFADPVLTP